MSDGVGTQATSTDASRVRVRVRERPRAVLIVNPYSSGMTSQRERTIVRRLREHVDLHVMRTERGGHAPKLARQAHAELQPDIIFSCGGDGTANEILNGLNVGPDTADSLPALAVIPAGGTNVLARSVGHPNHPVRAVDHLVTAIREHRTKTINVGVLDERLFLFAAGIGLDGEMVRRIEQKRRGRRPGDLAHMSTIVGIFATRRFALRDTMTVRIADTGEELRASMLMIGNTTPMTYWGRLAVHFMPDCTLNGGLDIVAPHKANAGFAIRNGMQAMGMGRNRSLLVREESLNRRHDLRALSIECDDPTAVQVDGEYIGERTHISVSMHERAIRMYC